MSEKETRVVVCALIENKEGKILLTERHDPQDQEADGKWEFPGGGVEYGESLEQCLHREVKEEVGLETEIVELLPYYHSHIWTGTKVPFHVLLFVFWTRAPKGNIRLQSEESRQYVWVAPEEAIKYDLLPANKEFIETFIAERKKHGKK